MIVQRYYRAALSTYVPPAVDCDALTGRKAALSAEADLRTLVDIGESPTMVLVAPERGCVADIGPDGTVSGVYAWTEAAPEVHEHAQLIEQHRGQWSVLAVIETNDAVPDPIAPDYAAAGSVLVNAGTIQAFIVHAWLAPIAQQLTAAYGVAVYGYQPPGPRPVVRSDNAIVRRGAMSAEHVAELVAYLDNAETGRADSEPDGPLDWTAAPVNDGWGERLFDLLTYVGDQFELPVDSGTFHILRYGPGAGQTWHTDIGDEDPESLQRTVAFSLLLSDTDQFDGGQLQVKGRGTIDLQSGDLAAFTAMTMHRVTPIESGERVVLVGFGRHDR